MAPVAAGLRALAVAGWGALGAAGWGALGALGARGYGGKIGLQCVVGDAIARMSFLWQGLKIGSLDASDCKHIR